ncbi:MAG: MBL fold metallo-hydrolase [Candidatus Uhrbacteria bacterium]|nr:MBL fold metallo-hydrolase [Patescibacteria group bacterium]MBU1906614.1 MBL fold metallo-hydrolase [Patescibacteria group bacterium]
MKIKILGTRGEVKPSTPYHAHHSGVLIDETLMFDLGEEGFLQEKPKAVFITHLHSDHAFFVTREPKRPIAVPIYAPEQAKRLKLSVLRSEKRIGAYRIKPIPTIHSKLVKSQAYLIKKGKQRILYTGDMIRIKKSYHRELKNLDLVITDGSFIRKGGMVRRDKASGEIFGHQGVPDLVRSFSRFTDRILFTHFGSWFYKDMRKARQQMRRLGREHQIKIYVGYDGMELRV